MHNLIAFAVDVNSLTLDERKKATKSLMFLTEKRNGTTKGKTYANGSTQHSYASKDEASSPTAATESILLTTAIEAKEERDVTTLDIPNAFLQTSLPKDETTDERIIMKLRGILVDMGCIQCWGRFFEIVRPFLLRDTTSNTKINCLSRIITKAQI